MKIEANTVSEYLEKIEHSRKDAFVKLRDVIVQNIPEEFVECISYGMVGYVVPHSIYPNGYHCTPDLPLPFMHIACQKNYIALYSSTINMDKEVRGWFIDEYAKCMPSKIDIGKSCVRFKKDIPYTLISELVAKVSVAEFIKVYESSFKK
jgi:uncharacterized protein YdhG (YjbR/CyaY superfamily)